MSNLDKLLKEAAEKVKSMSQEELNQMKRQQAEGWAKAEASWPKPNFHWENGAKVYHSYEDYLND